MSKGDRKSDYFGKVHDLFRTYRKIFVVGVDNVSSTQMHQIRHSIRGKAVLLMGKNTMIKKAMRDIVSELPDIEALFPVIKGNVGFVFTNEDLKEVRDIILSNKIDAPAKVGTVSQCDVIIPPGNTGISPDKTSFFQTLGIPTKVVKGAIEILNEVSLLKEGHRVGASEAELLSMLSIMPFKYGFVLESVYDNGAIFGPEMLDITEESMMKIYNSTLNDIAAISLAISFPTVASVPHMLINGFKDLLACSLSTDYSFPASQRLKDALANPQAFAPAAAAPAASAAPAKAAAKEEPEEESDQEMGFGLFD
ncbi:ribosomal protein P0 (A0) (L10E) [Mitosporidium daphniae]|uniref:60S acidic ribosomal protein P0 n=1 Tax=Mitosporidium daphniae TaxID=1485682 RepID=A0A098VQZ2_9MICR|nr:ArbP-ProV-like protein [Mitosporidium daphniae]KGG51355.1 ArbP-ProV-like protein [Mitosporidium daphniae]|eukprot:XP_013237782.1 ArbP-ProV-like protein [Mitosporidium daphniae]